jgi:hypothetical protein
LPNAGDKPLRRPVFAIEPTPCRPRCTLYIDRAITHGRAAVVAHGTEVFMRKSLLALPLAALLLGACVVSPDGRGPGVGVSVGIAVPALPLIVELGSDGYYVQGGYTYYYDDSRWRYAPSRSGPWVDLPRSHYPRETRFRDRSNGRDRDRDRDRDQDRDRGRGPDRHR